jgi:hypothetical protein
MSKKCERDKGPFVVADTQIIAVEAVGFFITEWDTVPLRIV